MRYIYVSLIAVLVVASGASFAHAQTRAEIEAQIASHLRQVQLLQAQLKTLDGAANVAEGENELRLNSRLRVGSNGEDVRRLQEFLATDPAIFPEGAVTGFFGPLTEVAVKRLQAKLKLEQVGAVGPQTLARINEILSNIKGELPPDLLSSRVKIEIEIKDGVERVKIEVKCDSSGKGNSCKDVDDVDEDGEECKNDEDECDEDELEIEVEIEGGKAHVEVEQDGDKDRFVFHLTDRAAIIEKLAERLGLSKSEIEAVIEFDEGEDEDDDEEEED